jgi:hypothetical protein
MTANSDLRDEAIKLGLVLDALAQNSFGIVMDRLMQLSDDLAMLVVKLDPTAVIRDANRRARLEILVDQANRVISEAYDEIESQVSGDLDDVAELSQDSLSELLALLLLIKGLSRKLDDDALAAARRDTLVSGASIEDWWQRQSVDMQFRTARALQDAMRLSQIGKEPGTGDLVNAIRDTGPGSLFTAAPRNAEGLIRSAHHAVANRVRFETAIRHPELFRALAHLSVLDINTSDICRSRSGLLWTLDGTPIGHSKVFILPPLHYNCRSHIIPVLHAFKDFPPRLQRRIDPDDFDGRTADSPDLKKWLEQRRRERDQGPTDYSGARKELGL